ncbi:MAG TPA: site-specific integrase [Gemmatimonadetes bacterium]|nr:site-specific integrase [Gemmatimonadota bacterium]
MRKRSGVRLPRVYQPKGRVNWYVRLRWEGREVVRLAGMTEARAKDKSARAYAARVEGRSLDEILSEIFGDPSGDKLDELAALYLDHVMKAKTKRRSTLLADVGRLRRLRKCGWAKKPVASVTSRDISRWANERAREVRPATLNRDLSMGSVIFSWGVSHGYLDENVFVAVNRPSEKGNARQLFLSPDQVHQLLKVASVDLRPFLLAAVTTGMRRGELLALCWDDVDFDAGAIRVTVAASKTKSERRVPMTLELRTTLRSMKSERKVFAISRGGGHVFASTDGKRMTPKKLQLRWERALTQWKNAPADLRFHDLRHTAASLMVNAGQDLYVVGEVLGHSSAQTTKRYAHLLLDRKRTAVDALGHALRTAMSGTG